MSDAYVDLEPGDLVRMREGDLGIYVGRIPHKECQRLDFVYPLNYYDASSKMKIHIVITSEGFRWNANEKINGSEEGWLMGPFSRCEEALG